MQFAWFNSVGDFDYFSAWLPLLVMSCMLRPTASDYWAFVKTSAHRQAVITSELEKHRKAHKAIFQVLSLREGSGCTAPGTALKGHCCSFMSIYVPCV